MGRNVFALHVLRDVDVLAPFSCPVPRLSEPLYVHLTSQGVDFLQMSFRWMNCLLMRYASLVRERRSAPKPSSLLEEPPGLSC